MKKQKKYWQMTSRELANATKEFDQEFVADTFRPMTKAEQMNYRRRVKRGRPVVGNGAKVVAISVERSRLARIDAYAEAHGISRSELLLSGAERIMAIKRAVRGNGR